MESRVNENINGRSSHPYTAWIGSGGQLLSQGFLLIAALLWDRESVNPILLYVVWIVNFLVTFLTPSLVAYSIRLLPFPT